MQTTALNIPAGAAQVISITLSTLILRRFPVREPHAQTAWDLPMLTPPAELQVLDSNDILCSIHYSRGPAHDHSVEQPHRSSLLVLRFELRRSPLLGYDHFLGHGDLIWPYEGIWSCPTPCYLCVVRATYTASKKLAVNAALLIGYSLGQTLCTQFWRAQYKPRNYVPYGIILVGQPTPCPLAVPN